MQDYWHFDFKCPFFRRDDRLTVHCEGGSRLVFPTPEAIKIHFNLCCCSMNYTQCSVAAMLLRHYNEKENKT